MADPINPVIPGTEGYRKGFDKYAVSMTSDVMSQNRVLQEGVVYFRYLKYLLHISTTFPYTSSTNTFNILTNQVIIIGRLQLITLPPLHGWSIFVQVTFYADRL